MRFLKVSALNAVAVAVRMITGLITNKLLALFVGPGGYAVIGQFQNAMSVATTFAGTATVQGVTRYTAEYEGDEARRQRVMRTAATLTLAGCALAGVILIGAAGPLAAWLLKDRSQAPVFVALALGLPAIGLNALLLAVLNGRQDTRRYVLANICGSLAGLALTGLLAATLRLTGALLALALSQSIAFAATLLLVRHRSWFTWSVLRVGRLDRSVLAGLGRYALMALTAATAGPIAQTVIRQHIVSRLGLDPAGMWDGVNRLSAMVLLFFTTTLQVYYLPRIAQIRTGGELRAEVRQLVMLIAPVVAIGLLAVWAARDPIVRLLFDRRFLPMANLFAPQLIGDFFKIVSWIFAFVMVGRGLTVLFIATEVGFSTLYAGSAVLATDRFGATGASIGYASMYAVYLVVTWMIFRRHSRDDVASGAFA